jgi:hypothetical protein
MRQARSVKYERYRTRRDSQFVERARSPGFIAPARPRRISRAPAAQGKVDCSRHSRGGGFLPDRGRGLPASTRAGSCPMDRGFRICEYADDGSSSIEMYSTSYSVDGNETIWSRSIPGNPFKTALGTIIDIALPIHNRVMPPLMLNAQQIERMKRARAENFGIITGCGPQCLTLEHFFSPKAVPGCIAGAVAGREKILNDPTAAVRQRWTDHGRMTLWTASDLGCFALRVTYEEERAGGDFHLVAAKQAVKVTVNP